jgi:hypothetical protein
VIVIDPFRQKLSEFLPDHLTGLLAAEWIPWALVRQRHGDLPNDPVVALFSAYKNILSSSHPVQELAACEIPPDSSGCLRCGTCCTFMRPGSVSAATYRKWKKRGALVSDFYKSVEKGRNPRHTCWFFGGTRLRICPLLLQNSRDQKPFCSIHHLGRGYRPSACARFVPNPPLCSSGQEIRNTFFVVK